MANLKLLYNKSIDLIFQDVPETDKFEIIQQKDFDLNMEKRSNSKISKMFLISRSQRKGIPNS